MATVVVPRIAGAVAYDPTAIGITGGTIMGGTLVGAVPGTLVKRAIPFIKCSSGTMGNNGALSAITALGAVYAKCFLYLPANAISAGSIAGWYYAQMSSTTAGTVFNNTYTTGIPSLPTPTAFVTTGPGAFTGDTTEQGITIPVAANSLGANGMLRVWLFGGGTNSATNKVFRVRYDGSSGSTYFSNTFTTQQGFTAGAVIMNRGVTNSQAGNGWYLSNAATAQTTNTVSATSAADTTASTSVFISAQNSTAATDNAVIEGLYIELVSDAT